MVWRLSARTLPDIRKLAVSLALLTALLPLAAGPAHGQGASAGDEDARRDAVRAAIEQIAARGTAVNRAAEPYRRRIPADPAAWDGVDDLLRAVGDMARAAYALHSAVDSLRVLPGFRPDVRPSELKRRLVAVDSLAAIAEEAAAQAYRWRSTLPDEPDDARRRLAALIARARAASDRSAAGATDLAYAVGVTEGINRRALNLSLVGAIVVFVVLALIAAVVGSVRRLDDRWQQQELAHAAAAVHREPTIDQTTVVLIAAACATLITGRHRVRRIRRLLSPATKRTPWSAQGRLILQGSHTVGRKHT